MLNTVLPARLNQAPGKKIKLRLLRRDSALLLKLRSHPLKPGQRFKSLGGTFKYRVIGACCRLYDRSNLPYPCCRLLWGSKEPFWNRIGKRFVPDIAVKRSPSYCVQLVDYPEAEPFVMTLHWVKLSAQQQAWWYSKRVLCCGGGSGWYSEASTKTPRESQLPSRVDKLIKHET